MSIYRFGPFEVRTRVRELYRSGTKVRLRGQPFQLLQVLLNHAAEVVTREQMRDELWPSDTFVDFEHGINASLRKLRQALGDSALKPLYIETLPGVGYRFIAPHEIIEEPPAKGGEFEAEHHSLADEMDDVENGTAPVRRRWIPLALAAGAVVFLGLFLFIAKWNRRVVHGATGSPSNAQAGINSAAQGPDAPAHQRAAPKSGNSPLRSGSPLNPGLSPIRGKIWVVSVARASNVSFPPPDSIPDATFVTKGIAYIGTGPKNCYTVASFLTECAIGGYELKFSGIPNSNLGGAPAGPDTAMSGDTWGILVEFVGTTNFIKGQGISILHDDGVALEIDGQPIPDFDALPTSPIMETSRFTGPSGLHTFDLLYANAGGGGAWILFYPALY
jgi:DNA-binding winged helix-turn-helix (wHTH) protein